jgi:HK97 family phage portal protein
MFPAIRSAVKEFREGFGSDPIRLGLETKAGGQGVDWYARNGFQEAYARHLDGGPTWSGQPVTVDTAQNHSVVWACERIISESMAFMPLAMMQETEKGKFPAVDHPAYSALKNAPNDEMTSMGFRETLTGHCVLGGNCYGQIMRRSGTEVAVEFYPLLPTQVTPDRDAANRLVYVVKDGNVASKTYTVERGKPHDILHVRGLGNDGIRGYSVINVARQSIGTAQSAEKYAAKFFAAGGRTPWVMEMAQSFKTKQDGDKFTEDFTKWLAEQNNWHKGLILEPGMTYKNMGMSPQESQFLDSRLFEIPEICRWFLISPYMVGELSHATFSNIEHLALQFVKMTLTAWMTRWEQELWRCVLTPEEKRRGYYFRHNVNGLLRGDFVTRMAGYASALQNAHLNIDEVRDLEDRNPLPNGAGKAYHLQLAQQTVPGTGEPTAAEVSMLAKASTVGDVAAAGAADEVQQLRAELEKLRGEIQQAKAA